MKNKDLLNYLFSPEKNNTLNESINDNFQKEIESVDEYLNKKIPEIWSRIQIQNSFHKNFKLWSWSWKQTLLTRLVLSEINKKDTDIEETLSKYIPIQIEDCVYKGKYQYEIVQNASYLDIELKKIYHPDVIGRVVTVKNSIKHLNNPVEIALDFIESLGSNFFDLIANSVGAFALLEVEPNLQIGQCVSLSINSSPGIILSTVPSKILFSETILHEACHSRLNSAQKITAFWVLNDKLLATPLRSDLRPISGLFHQCYVLFWLSKLYEKMLKRKDNPDIKKNFEKIYKRFMQHKMDLKESCDLLLKNEVYLSDCGIQIIKHINSKND